MSNISMETERKCFFFVAVVIVFVALETVENYS